MEFANELKKPHGYKAIWVVWVGNDIRKLTLKPTNLTLKASVKS
jgi:hypothetical protein